MRNNIFIMLFALLVSSTVCYSQKPGIPVTKEDIAGRWTEVKRIEGENTYYAGEHPDTYIFRDNMIFHKGESSEGVILFGVTGRYSVDGDSILILYKDYTERDAGKQNAKKLIFKILSLSENEMLVLVSDYDYQYKMLLGK